MCYDRWVGLPFLALPQFRSSRELVGGGGSARLLYVRTTSLNKSCEVASLSVQQGI